MRKVLAMRGCRLTWSCPQCDFKHTQVVTESFTFDVDNDYPPEMVIHAMTEGHYSANQ